MMLYRRRSDANFTIQQKLELLLEAINNDAFFPRCKMSVTEDSNKFSDCAGDKNTFLEEAIKGYPDSVVKLFNEYIVCLQCQYIDAVQKRDVFILQKKLRLVHPNDEQKHS